MRPKLIISSNDLAPYIEELGIQINDLDADGSGRSITDGKMYRTRVARKVKLDVKLMPLDETELSLISSIISPTYVNVLYLNPLTNEETTGEFYCSSINYGNQLYHNSESTTYYYDGSFSLTER